MHNRTVIIAVVSVLALLGAGYMLFVAPHKLMAPVPVQPEGWTRSAPTGQGLTFAYPVDLNASFVGEAEWPPQVTLIADAYSCAAGTSSPGSFVEERVINGRTYCVSSSGEGAAGSTYVTYDYRTAIDIGTLSTTFTFRFPQCLNYDEPNRTACQAQQLSFNPDALAAGIIASVTLP